jgi:hypothetical protein
MIEPRAGLRRPQRHNGRMAIERLTGWRFKVLRDFLRTLIRILPISLGMRIVRAWRLRRPFISRLRFRLTAFKAVKRYLSDDTIHWVDPKKIVFAMDSEGFYEGASPAEYPANWEFEVYEYKGRVIGGDWDRLKRRFSDLDFYRSYEERALKGTSWEQLPYYRRVLGQIKNGNGKWDCRSKQDLDERCRGLDIIFNDIKQNGYKSRLMLERERGKDSLYDADDEIAVNIGRYGDLIFNNGRHRLTFAKLAGIEKVPVTVTIRHSDWVKFVKEVEGHVQKNNGRVSAPLTHIDLQAIPVHYGAERFEMIRRNVGDGNSTLLDIGARWGYFCHRFEEAGFHCTAVENDPENLYFLRKLRRVESRSFEVIPESILALSQKGPLKYDIVLALYILHRFLKVKASFEDLKLLLRSLDMNEMYFEPQPYDETRTKGAFVSFSPEEFVGFILENSCLNSYKMIGKYADESIIYKLWR